MTSNRSSGVLQEAIDAESEISPAGQRRGQVISCGAIAAIALCLYASSRYNYLLFHGLVELASIAIGFTLFIITWNVRHFLAINTLKILGIGYAFIAGIDLLHTLAYKGMNVFPGSGANLPTQLWIAARYLQAATLCAAPLLLRRKIDEHFLVGLYAAVVALLVALVFTGLFPDCFIDGKGLTPFKIGSEYLIIAMLGGALALFHRSRTVFNPRVYALLVASIVCTALSELSFTAYLSVYGFANMLGHLLKLAAFYLIYRALLVTGFTEPYQLIFRELKEAYDRLGEVNVSLELEIEERRTAEDELRETRNDLEHRVAERTVDLRSTNERLQQELAERRQVEAALQESEARFRRLAENARDVIYRMSLPAGTYEYISPAAREIFGYAPEEFYASPHLFRSVIHPQWHDYFAEQWEQLLQGEMPPTYEYKIVHKSGEERWLNQRNILVRDDTGRIVAIEGIVTDITDRKIPEEELCKLNEELEQRVRERTAELEQKNAELEKMNRLFVGRELRMVELKQRIRALEAAHDIPGEKS